MCGMWKLLHVVTVGVAEHHGGVNLVESSQMAANSTRTFSPAEAAEAIREYMSRFLTCDECRENFLRKYDTCALRRCDRLTYRSGAATPDDWKQLSLWMWELHNEVNVRVLQKKAKEEAKRLACNPLEVMPMMRRIVLESEIVTVLWPSLEDCVVCFDDDGKWNENSVFEVLERTYWDPPDAKFNRLLVTREGGYYPGGGGIIGWCWSIVLSIALLCIVWNLHEVLRVGHQRARPIVSRAVTALSEFTNFWLA